MADPTRIARRPDPAATEARVHDEVRPIVPVMRPVGAPLSAALPRLETVQRSGSFGNFGAQEQELRRRFADRLGVPATRVATASNATLALAGAVAVLGGDRWLVPAFTFPASIGAVHAAGAQPVLGDIDDRTWCLNPGRSLDSEITDAPAGADLAPDGFIPVAPFGSAPDLDRWVDFPRVVHDAAASIGMLPDLSGLGSGHAVVFSLHATKVMGSGEGGLIVFGSGDMAERFRSWSNFGFAGSRESQVAGLNAKMSEVQACFAHAALEGWEHERAEWLAARELVVSMAASTGISLFAASQGGVNPYVIAVFDDEATASRVEHAASEQGVGTRRWWGAGCHHMPAYRHLAVREFPVTERVAAVSLGLPMFRGMTAMDVARIARSVESALRRG